MIKIHLFVSKIHPLTSIVEVVSILPPPLENCEKKITLAISRFFSEKILLSTNKESFMIEKIRQIDRGILEEIRYE